MPRKAAHRPGRLADSIQRVDNVATNAAGGSLFQLRNVGTAENIGFETDLRYGWSEAFKVGANYTRLNRRNLSARSLFPTDTPAHKVLGWVEARPLDWISFIPSAEWNDFRYSTTYGVRTGDFLLVDIKLAVRLPGGFALNGGIQNALDRDHALVEGFPEAGRTFFANLTYRF